MSLRVAFSELASLAPDQRSQRVAELARATGQPPNGELQEIEARIAALEEQHGVSSDALRRELAQGQRRETWEICRWLQFLDIRDHLVSLTARTR
jgi:hypothetical protein